MTPIAVAVAVALVLSAVVTNTALGGAIGVNLHERPAVGNLAGQPGQSVPELDVGPEQREGEGEPGEDVDDEESDAETKQAEGALDRGRTKSKTLRRPDVPQHHLVPY
jgi:hypothetical protein